MGWGTHPLFTGLLPTKELVLKMYNTQDLVLKMYNTQELQEVLTQVKHILPWRESPRYFKNQLVIFVVSYKAAIDLLLKHQIIN